MSIKLFRKKWQDLFKVKNHVDINSSIFSEIEIWEEEYLVKKIQNQFTDIPEEAIRNAVKSCYTSFNTPQSGEKLIQSVISILGIKRV